MAGCAIMKNRRKRPTLDVVTAGKCIQGCC
jgi:hypothetical protein